MSTVPNVAVLQHVACEGPGRIAAALERRGIGSRVLRIDLGEAVPATLDGWSGLVAMGGPMGVYESNRHPHLNQEMLLVERAVAAGRPVLGICLGSQLLAAALGARVAPGRRKEIGWYEVALSEEAARDRLLGGAPRRLTPLHWHGDVFELPRGAVSLASSELTEHQAFRFGERAWGLLFHLEADAAQLEAMAATFADELAAAGIAPQAILRDAASRLAALAPIGDAVFGAFADLIVETGAR